MVRCVQLPGRPSLSGKATTLGRYGCDGSPRDTPSPRDIPPSWTSTAIATNIRVRRKFQLHGHEPTDAVIVVVVVIVRKIIRVRRSLVWHCHATHKVLWRLAKRAVVDIDMVVANIIADAVAFIPSQSFPACNLLCRKNSTDNLT
jgi:hypothetical protein